MAEAVFTGEEVEELSLKQPRTLCSGARTDRAGSRKTSSKITVLATQAMGIASTRSQTICCGKVSAIAG